MLDPICFGLVNLARFGWFLLLSVHVEVGTRCFGVHFSLRILSAFL